jgi:hypothetical protein
MVRRCEATKPERPPAGGVICTGERLRHAPRQMDGCSKKHILKKPEEIIMFRRISIALVAATALGSAALAPTSVGVGPRRRVRRVPRRIS